MPKQSSIYSFFSKGGSENDVNDQESPRKNIKLKGKSVGEFDLVWAKLGGYPWWPAIVCPCPGGKEFIRQNMIHVQFFDIPPSRSWVKDIMVKPYCPPIKAGIPTYKDPAWVKAVKQGDKAQEKDKADRQSLIVEMPPSDEEDMEENSDEGDDSDKSKENVSENITPKNKKRSIERNGGNSDNKRRRVILCSDSESEDEYKPEKEIESEDSASSGVDENMVSEPETESEFDSPVKTPKIERKKPVLVKSNGMKSLSNSPVTSAKSSPSTPRVSAATKSTLAVFAAKENVGDVSSGNGGNEDWPFLHYQWLKPNGIKDRKQRSPGHPDYDKRTLFVPDSFLKQQTPGMRQWWELKSQHYDTVLFFKMGKFYELFHMDAILGVQELGLLMMKGDNAHVGFPEIAYGRYSSTLIDKGYKVARIEQTETPEMMEQRCKNLARPTKFDRVVRREVCQVTSQATRVYSFLDGEDSQAATSHLLAITERGVTGGGDGSEFGVAFVDTSTAQFYVGQFIDDRHLSRLRTLLSHYPVAQILMERGRLSQKTLSLVNATVSSGLREMLVPEKEFWDSNKTLSFLADGPYFRTEKQEEEKMEKGETKTRHEPGIQWPEDLKLMLDDGDPLGLTARGEYEIGVSALGGLVWYLQDCKLDEQLLTRRMLQLYNPPDKHSSGDSEDTTTPASITITKHHMVLDGTTLRNLEVFENSIGGTESTLIDRLDHCSTPFGKRLLRRWVCSPLCQRNSINERLKAITDLRNQSDVLQQATQLLKTLPDLERILAKVHTQGLKRQSSHPDTRAIFFEGIKYNKRKVMDFLAALNGFKITLQILSAFDDVRTSLTSKLLHACVSTTEDGGNFPLIKEALGFFDNAFDHSEAEREGKIIPCSGVDAEYDDAVRQIKTTKDKLAAYLKDQCSYFGTKVVYWGSDKKRYQLEMPDHACRKAGEEYELMSQKKGFKRYWTPETREMLSDMMAAEEQRNSALGDIARRIFRQFDEYHEKWEAVLQCLSVLDVLASLTQYSKEANTVMPEVVNLQENKEPFLEIRDGLHPCVISTFSGEEFIPNDVILGQDGTHSLTLVTGPNMGGKSTLMRQTALICILAQLGSYVPASSCRLSPVDRVFTRLGTSDRIMMGESTFMVELAETSSIIQHATPHSLVLVDELGRGTASYDGMAIASGVVNALMKRSCRTLFSTHYHSLVDDFSSHHNVSLGHMACMVEDENEDDPSQETITFLYKFTDGACPKSYGFNAARLADLPDQVIRRGSLKARELEKSSAKKHTFRKLFCGISGGSDDLRDSVKSIQCLL